MKRNIPIVLAGLLFVVMFAFAIMNTHYISISLFGMPVEAAAGSLCFGFYIIGALSVLGAAKGTAKIKQIRSGEIEDKWQKQDEKLAKENQSDKEKQLEAKILTLEAALKSALEKKKRTEEI